MFEGGGAEGTLESIKEHEDELLSVLLDTDVDRVPVEVLETVAEIHWVVVPSLCFLEEGEEFLELVEEIVIVLSVVVNSQVHLFVVINSEH